MTPAERGARHYSPPVLGIAPQVRFVGASRRSLENQDTASPQNSAQSTQSHCHFLVGIKPAEGVAEYRVEPKLGFGGKLIPSRNKEVDFVSGVPRQLPGPFHREFSTIRAVYAKAGFAQHNRLETKAAGTIQHQSFSQAKFLQHSADRGGEQPFSLAEISQPLASAEPVPSVHCIPELHKVSHWHNGTNSMRVLLVGFGTVGDVQPLAALGNGLKVAGHTVLLCGRPDIPRWIDLRGLDFLAIGAAPQIQRRRAPWFIKLHGFAHAEAEPQFDALSDAARGADLLVSAGSQLVAASVARALGIRHRSVVYCPQMMPSRGHPPMTVAWRGAPPFIHRAGRRLFMEVYNRMVRTSVAACPRKVGLDYLRDEFSANFLTNPLIACDPELAPVPEDCPLQFDQVGYIHSQSGGNELPAPLRDFLAAGPPPVYIGFGSTIPAPPARLTRLIARAVVAVGCRAVVSSGWAGLGGVEHQDNLRFTGPVSHYRLFPQVAAVIHHGGAGTTATAARAGKPQVILPPGLYDQAFWRAQVVERGIGVWAPKPRSLTVRKLARLLVHVLSDRETARRAAELGEILIRRNAIGKAVAALTGSGHVV